MKKEVVYRNSILALERLTADEKQHCAMIDALKGDKQFLDVKCERLTAERDALSATVDGYDERRAIHNQYCDKLISERDAAKAHIEEAGREVLKLVQERDALQRQLIVAEGARDALNIFNDQLIAENAALRADAAIGRELIMLVGTKYPNETRADTARRYIMKAEEAHGTPDCPKSAIAGEKT